MRRLFALVAGLLQRSAVLSLIRIGGAGIGFFAHLMLAWILPPAELGIFYAATSLAAVAGVITAQGYPQISARFAVRYGVASKTRLFRLFVGQVLSDGTRLSLLIGATIGLTALLYPGLDYNTRATFIAAGLMVPAITALNLCTNLAGALKHFGICYVPEGLFRPVFFFLAVGVIAVSGWHVASSKIALVFAVVTFGVAFYVYRALRPLLPRWSWQPARGVHGARRWRHEAWPLVLLSLFTNFFVDIAIICATPFLAAADIAVFGLCLKLAMLAGYVVQVAQQMAAPDLAAARRDHKAQDIARILRRSIVVPALATAIAAVAVALFGGRMLALFGPSFAVGQTTLLLLVIVQFVRALAGPSAHLITLTGAQNVNAALAGGAIILLLAAYQVLTPWFGLNGAGMAVVLAFAVWLGAMAVTLQRLGEFRTDAFSLLGREGTRLSLLPLKS